MTSHRSHGCRPPARQHSRAPVYVRMYVRLPAFCQPSPRFSCIYIPRMTERMVASNRAPRDAISDCSTLLDLLTNPVATTIRTICLRAPPFQRLFRIRFVNDTNFRVLYICIYISYVVSLEHFFQVYFLFLFKIVLTFRSELFLCDVEFFFGKETE